MPTLSLNLSESRSLNPMTKLVLWSLSLLLGAVGALLSGCETAPLQPADTRARFHESANASVVLHFHRWDTINMLQPDTREGGFLPFLDRAGVRQALTAHQIGRELAVVVLGHSFSAEFETELVRDWNAFLFHEGFKRVVLLRSGFNKNIDGLIILHDSAIAASDERPLPDLAARAVFPPAARADVANPSGN